MPVCPAGWVLVTCQSDPELPQMVCGRMLFHSPLSRASDPNWWNPLVSGEHHAQAVDVGGAGDGDGLWGVGLGRVGVGGGVVGAGLGDDCVPTWPGHHTRVAPDGPRGGVAGLTWVNLWWDVTQA